MRLLVIVLSVVGTLACPDVEGVAVPQPRPKVGLTEEEKALRAITPAEDAEREKLIATAQGNGWLGEVDYQHHKIVVGRGFAALDFKMKEAVVWAVVLNGMRKTMKPQFDVALVDPKTNETVGTYTLSGRLQLR